MNSLQNKVLYCERSCFPFFEDYINSFLNQINLNLIIVNNLNTVDYNKDVTYFFIGKLPQFAYKSKFKIFYINMEQLTQNNYLTYCQTISKFGIPIINYNEANCQLIPNSILIRYQYESFSLYEEKRYDVAFVGSIGSRREKILNQLQEDGIQVHRVEGWGETRDKEILQAKILLNIHYEENYKIYESLRCDRFLFNGMIVVTETSMFQELLDVNDLLIVADYSDLVSKVKDVLQNYSEYIEKLEIKRETILPSIIESRKNDLI